MIGARTLGHAASELRAHPGRALLSAVSLLLGVASIVAIFTISQVVEDSFVAAAEQAHGRDMTAQATLELPGATPQAIRAAGQAAAPLTHSGGGYAIIVEPTGGTALAPSSPGQPQGPMTFQTLTMVAGDLAAVRRLQLLDGRWYLTNSDTPIELVMNLAGARRWGGVGTSLSTLTTKQQPPIPAHVVGVIADGDSNPRVYLPLIAVLNARPTTLQGRQTTVLLHSPTADLPTLQLIADQMAAASGGKLPDRIARADGIEGLRSRLRTQQQAFLIIAALTLIIAALGILNIGLASVAERTRELVVRRALGATRSAILAQMLLAALVPGILAAAIAVASGIAVINWWLPTQIDPATALAAPAFPQSAAVWGVAAAIITALAGAAAPALMAARLDVATALRD
ncbi:ABC transporter permease [Hamadaea sp. NPDC051192]|uniref:ABC transporter permease n=1 Tax=Hamadaea sp. NPDC051192 TaxID=3154940 RepID=UPI00344909F7